VMKNDRGWFGSPAAKRIRVKICGITNRIDAVAAIECGADAVGFNLHPGSGRFIDLAQAGGWIENLPREVCRVAVMVNPSLEELFRVAALRLFDLLQLHGQEAPEFCSVLANAGIRFAKAIPVTCGQSLVNLPSFHTAFLILDSAVGGRFGGTGQTFSWPLASHFVKANKKLKVVLAGGLTPENVSAAVSEVRPFGVDVTSGVEISGHRKDRDRIKAFIEAVRSFRF